MKTSGARSRFSGRGWLNRTRPDPSLQQQLDRDLYQIDGGHRQKATTEAQPAQKGGGGTVKQRAWEQRESGGWVGKSRCTRMWM